MLDRYKSSISSSRAEAWHPLIKMHSVLCGACIKLEGGRIHVQAACDLSFVTCGLCSGGVFIALFSVECSLLLSFCFAVIIVFSLNICFWCCLASILWTDSLVWIAKTGVIFPGLRDETLLIDGTSFGMHEPECSRWCCIMPLVMLLSGVPHRS